MKNDTKFDYDKQNPMTKEFVSQLKCQNHDIINEEEEHCFSSNADLGLQNSNQSENTAQLLLETEIIKSDQKLIPKNLNKPFSYKYLQTKLDSCKTSIKE